MSYETTLARFDANAAEAAWREHRRHCPGCTAAARARLWSALCDRGADLRAHSLNMNRELAAARKADKAPRPGQEAMF